MLNHKNIIKVLHSEESESRVCMVLSYAAEGTSPPTSAPRRSLDNCLHQQSRTLCLPMSFKVVILITWNNDYPHSPQVVTSFRRASTGSACRTCYDEGGARRLFRQLMRALHYLHLQGFIHRDVKPENILVHANANVLLGDVSLATIWNPRITRAGSCGTLNYAAPGADCHLDINLIIIFRSTIRQDLHGT